METKSSPKIPHGYSNVVINQAIHQKIEKNMNTGDLDSVNLESKSDTKIHQWDSNEVTNQELILTTKADNTTLVLD